MKALVAGGGGFLGSRICQMLLEGGHDVTALGRHPYPSLEKQGVRTVRADIRDASSLCREFAGMDVVFHVAALAGIWGPRRLFWEINVDGTANVIQACRDAGVAILVYTGSPSAVFGSQPLCGVDESVPYPSRYLAHYPATKAAAETLVLQANSGALATVALRPHFIWGPGDPHLLPRVIERARRGRLVQVGDGQNLADITYIDNAAMAHVSAAKSLLTSREASCAGKAYFISQGEPVRLWPWLNEVLAAVGVPTVGRAITFRSAYRVGWFFEKLYGLLRLRAEPPMTRFLAAQLSQTHYFDISAARADFGYEPTVSIRDGMDAFAASFLSR